MGRKETLKNEVQAAIQSLLVLDQRIDEDIAAEKEKSDLLHNIENIQKNLQVIQLMSENMLDPQQLLTLDEVAEKMCVARSTLQPWLDSGILRSIKSGKRFLITRQALMDFQQFMEGKNLADKKRIPEIRKEVSSYVSI